MRLLLAFVVACKGADDAPHLRPTHAGPVSATTNAFEQPLADGSPMRPMTIAAYRQEFASSSAVVFVKAFPPDLSASAGAGVNMEANGKNVSWVVDGDPKRGY